MTRQTALKLLAGVFGGLIAKAQTSMTLIAADPTLATISLGDAIPHDEFMKRTAACQTLTCLEDLTSARVPGTATLTLNLDGWKGFKVTMGKDEVFISRQELWEALRK